MLPDPENYSLPHDAENYTAHVEPSGPNMARNTSADGLTFPGMFAAVPLLVFAVGSLFAIGAKKFRVWRPLSFLILFVSFVPALLDFSGVRGYLTGVNGMSVATMQHIDRAVTEFTTLTFWCAAASLVVCAVVLWRLPWTVVLMPLAVTVVYFVFPYGRLERTLYGGMYVTPDGLLHLSPLVATLLLCALASGWLWGRTLNISRVRQKVFR